MAHEAAAALLHPHVERVVLLHVEVRDPGADHAQAAQLASVLVVHAIGRIVVATALPVERPERPTGEKAARRGGVRTVGQRHHAREQRVHVRLGHRPAAALGIGEHDAGTEHHVAAAERDREVGGHVVAGGVQEPPGDRAGRARAARAACGIELEHVGVALCVLDVEAGRDALGLGARDAPRRRAVGPLAGGRAAGDLRWRHRKEPDPVREPARGDHLVERVDVGCRAGDVAAEPRPGLADQAHGVEQPPAGAHERLVERVAVQARVARLRHRRIVAVGGMPGHGPVDERRARGRRGRRGDEGEHERGGEDRPRRVSARESVHGHGCTPS